MVKNKSLNILQDYVTINLEAEFFLNFLPMFFFYETGGLHNPVYGSSAGINDQRVLNAEDSTA